MKKYTQTIVLKKINHIGIIYLLYFRNEYLNFDRQPFMTSGLFRIHIFVLISCMVIILYFLLVLSFIKRDLLV